MYWGLVTLSLATSEQTKMYLLYRHFLPENYTEQNMTGVHSLSEPHLNKGRIFKTHY